MTKVKKPAVRVRIAPSPTGELHIGTARTALFNWLFAKHHSDTFILRIEDTDRERSRLEYEKGIIAGLEWLGLKWDNEKIIRQSEQGKVYRKYLDKLVASGKVERRVVSEADKQAMTAEGRKSSDVLFVIQSDSGGGVMKFNDLIRGEIVVAREELGQQIIARIPDQAQPDDIVFLYNFSVVIDDITMEISHVIRGEDHISNTPKQLLIYEALAITPPQFTHLPLILAEDKSKLSKRHGATAVLDYRDKGYLPDALINFLALLGWTPAEADSGKELWTKNELIEKFSDLSKIHKSGAVFDIKKLNWLNSQYIKMENDAGLARLVLPFAEKYFSASTTGLEKIAPLLRERLEYLDQVKEFHYFFQAPEYATDLLVWKKSDRAGAVRALQTIQTSDLSNLNTTNLDKIAENNFAGDRGAVYWPLRVALSGEQYSADPVQIAKLLTVDEISARISTALEKLQS